jgi:NDP-sugar pyrophosphorylase family protein
VHTGGRTKVNSTIALGYGSGVKLSRSGPFGCTDVFIHVDEADAAWTNGLDAWSLPVGGEALLDRFASRVADAWDPVVTLCARDEGGTLAEWARRTADSSRMRMVAGDARGSAGGLKDASATLSGGTILVVDGAVWLDDDLGWMLRQHRAARNALTVFCAARPLTLRGEALSNLEPVSVYCCEPEVLDYVAPSGTQDIAAHLIPALQRAGLRVGVVTLRGDTCEICDWPSYLNAVGHALKAEAPSINESYEQIAPGVRRHPQATVSPSARIVGPVFIDRGCRVEAGAVVVGPTILGPDCVVEARARVIRTVAIGGSTFPMRPVVSDRLVAYGASVVEHTPSTGTAQSAARDADLAVTTGASSRQAVWLGLLMIVFALAWALSGHAANLWHAWSQSASLVAG